MQKFSLAVAKIEMFHRPGSSLVPGATGTAFFYKSSDDIFLITNWHNVTGVDPLTGKALHTKGLLPNLLRIHYKQWSNEAKTAVRSQHLDLSLYQDDNPIW